MATTKLNMAKILDARKFWKQIGVFIKKWIIKDSDKGILQGRKKTDAYRSKQYKKYKANYMNKFGRGAGKEGAGQKLKSVKGQSVANNKTSSVTMKLTGQLLRGLRAIKTGKDFVVMSYLDKDKDKIIGNSRFGRIIATLNDKNQRRVKKKYEDAINANIEKWAKQKVIINIGK